MQFSFSLRRNTDLASSLPVVGEITVRTELRALE